MQDKILFVERINPPWLLEIYFPDIKKVAIRRIFVISDDEGDYANFGVVDCNKDYVLVHMFSIKHFRPFFRIYKRGDSFFSIGHAEIEYTDFVDSGVFAKSPNV